MHLIKSKFRRRGTCSHPITYWIFVLYWSCSMLFTWFKPNAPFLSCCWWGSLFISCWSWPRWSCLWVPSWITDLWGLLLYCGWCLLSNCLTNVLCLHLLSVIQVALMSMLQNLILLHLIILLHYLFIVRGWLRSFDSQVRPIHMVVVRRLLCC